MYKIIISLFFFITAVSSLQAANQPNLQSVKCSPQLQNCIKKMLKVPEIGALIVSIQKEGPIQIVAREHSLSQQFGAFWNQDLRMIVVDMGSHRSEDEIIASILFELHNAQANSQFDYYDSLAASGKIDREGYVMAIEHIEYLNSKKAAEIAEKGIRSGIFTKQARLFTYRDFNEHFHYQKIGGHSAIIGQNYDLLISERRSFQLSKS